MTISKEEEVTEEVEIFLKRPSRKLFDECNLFYSVKISEGVKAGLLTRAMINKRYKNDGGGLSKQEQEEAAVLYKVLVMGKNLIKQKKHLFKKKRSSRILKKV